MSVRVTGAGQLKATFDRIAKATERAVARATTRGAMMVQKAARRRIMKGPKSGRRYGRHKASAPGQPPANDTGNLARSIAVVAAAPAPNAKAYVQVRTEYAAALEYGTLRAGKGHKVRIAERPFMRPSMAENRAEISRLIASEASKAIADATAAAKAKAQQPPPNPPGGAA